MFRDRRKFPGREGYAGAGGKAAGGRDCFRPVQLGRLRTEAKVINRSRNIAYAEGSILDSAGKLVARSTGTFMLTETLQQGERERV